MTYQFSHFYSSVVERCSDTIEADSVVVKGTDFDALCSLARENEQLRGNLSLAEEGLANYAQENAQLRALLAQAPIAKVTVRESGAGHYAQDDVSVSLYAPGLPPGEHDLYLMPSVPQSGLPSESAK